MYYFATFDVGTPAKPQSVIIDTGSDTMAFPCETCHGRNCGSHQYPRFKPGTSSTFKYKIRCSNPQRMGGHQVCKFVKSYAEGSSLYGFLADDLIRFKNAKAVYGNKLKLLNNKLVKDVRIQTEFGCTEKETGLFKTQYADGILGLDDQSEFINSLEQLNGNGRKVFSFGLCFHEHGGIMSIDLRNRYEPDDKIRMLNKDISKYDHPLIVPYDNSNMYFEIPLQGFWMGNDRVNLDVTATMMIDSGTTFTHFPNIIMRQILLELNKYCSKSTERCGKIPNAVFKEDSCLELRPPDENFKSAEELLLTFPQFHLYLNGRHTYKLMPKNYFYKEYLEDPKERKSGMTRLCMAIKGHNDEKIILGAFSMVDHYFYFDRKSQKVKIFEEDCYLRTKRLLKKDRILVADEPGTNEEQEEIEFSIPYKNDILSKPRILNFEEQSKEDGGVYLNGKEVTELQAPDKDFKETTTNPKKIKQRLLAGKVSRGIYNHSIFKEEQLVSHVGGDLIPSRRLTSRRRSRHKRNSSRHPQPRELYLKEMNRSNEEETLLLEQEEKNIEKRAKNERSRKAYAKRRQKFENDRRHLNTIPPPSLNDKISFVLTISIILAIIGILIRRRVTRKKEDHSTGLIQESTQPVIISETPGQMTHEGGYEENVVTVVEVKNEKSVLGETDVENSPEKMEIEERGTPIKGEDVETEAETVVSDAQERTIETEN